jgi:YD repeat-containing protein
METGTICPQCVTLLNDGTCPQCAASGKHYSETTSAKTGNGLMDSQARDILLVAAAVLLLFLLRFGIPYVLAMRADQRRAEAYAAKIVTARSGSPLASASELKGTGRIYLVQVGPHTAPYSLDDFTRWLHSKYALDVQVLPAMAVVSSAWDSGRKQYVAELLYEQLKRQHPDLAADPQAYLIGFTDEDMYSVRSHATSSYTRRDGQRAALISMDALQDTMWQRIASDHTPSIGEIQGRLRRMLLRDVAVLYWHLPLNNDATSLLQENIYATFPLEDIYQSDLDPEHTRWGRFEYEPCIFFGYTAKDGIKPLIPGALSHSCTAVDDESIHGESLELFEVDLRLGLLIDRHTDFYLPDTIPIQFQRYTRDGWKGPAAFGISGSHSYDRYLGSYDGMRTVTVLQPDGGSYQLKRVPSWLPILPMVKYVDNDSGRLLELRWKTNGFEHFDLKRYNGEVETYLPCDTKSPPCYQIGFRNAQGEQLIFERDTHRNLTKLTSPNKSWLRLSYGTGNRIAEITDSRGRIVRYRYDERGRLASVAYPSGEIFYYEYDRTQHLLTVSTAPDSNAKPLVLMRNEYESGKITKQTFADGKTYTYSYKPINAESVGSATVSTPDGKTYDLGITEWSSSVRVHDAPPKQ